MKTLALLPLLLACGPSKAGPAVAPPAPAPGASAERVEAIALEDGSSVEVRHGAAKDPIAAGCADGTREAFHDDGAFPRITGCMARWEGAVSMRAPRTGRSCGDQGTCGAPADACASGWHLCGATGALSELRAITADQCESAGGGRYSAAISHCRTQSGCEYDESPAATYECFPSGWCSEPVCCGANCGELGSCTGGVWPDRTHISQGTDQGCGQTTANRAGGVLCCKD